MLKHFNKYPPLIFLFIIISTGNPKAQMITGTWKGLIDKKKVELKIIQKGDSLFGTSYYYESAIVYKRYAIKGYFDGQTNETIWWDEQLIEEKKGRSIFKSPGNQPYLSSADFNCPGNDKMFLDGKAYLPPDRSKIKGKVNLEKTDAGIFNDEWDFIIDNYTAGANDPYLIDSVAAIASNPFTIPETIKADHPVRKETETILEEKKVTIAIPADTSQHDKPLEIQIEKVQTPTIEEKFIKREKIIAVEIPVAGDSIELRFYDNAEIDGDSITLFLNDKLIFQHIRLKASAYIIKLPVSELQQTNELVMVAENLGSIPPNTSYMLAIADNKRYEAMLKSTEETSAVIRIIKK